MINDELKYYIIDIIDEIMSKLYYHNHEKELNSIRRRYIYKDITKTELKEDHKRLVEIKQMCEVYTQMILEEEYKKTSSF